MLTFTWKRPRSLPPSRAEPASQTARRVQIESALVPRGSALLERKIFVASLQKKPKSQEIEVFCLKTLSFSFMLPKHVADISKRTIRAGVKSARTMNNVVQASDRRRGPGQDVAAALTAMLQRLQPERAAGDAAVTEAAAAAPVHARFPAGGRLGGVDNVVWSTSDSDEYESDSGAFQSGLTSPSRLLSGPPPGGRPGPPPPSGMLAPQEARVEVLSPSSPFDCEFVVIPTAATAQRLRRASSCWKDQFLRKMSTR